VSTFQRLGEGEFACTIGGERWFLSRRGDGGWVMSSATDPGSEISLDADEANAAFWFGQHERGAGLFLGASHSPLLIDDDPSLAPLQSLKTESCVYIDTTTVRNASQAVGYPTALSLLDLSVVTFGLVMSDTIYVQRGRQGYDGFLERFADAFHVLEFDRDFIEGPLWYFTAEYMNALTSESLAKAGLESRWQNFLGLESEIKFSTDAIDASQDSPYAWDGVPATHFFDTHLNDVNDFVSVQTVRALVNDNLAGAIGVPYISSSIRTPITSWLMANRIETQLLADQLIDQVAGIRAKKASRGPYATELSMPFLTAVAVKRSTSADDYWNQVAELREQFEPVRRKFREDREDWRGRKGPYLRDYVTKALGGAPSWVGAASSALETTATFAMDALSPIAPPGAAAGKLGIKLGFAARPLEHLHNWYVKHFKPDLSILIEMHDEVDQLRSLDSDLERVWGQRWDRRQLDQLERLAHARADSFSKLRLLA